MPISKTPKNTETSIFEAPTAQLFEDVDNEDNAAVDEQAERLAALEKQLEDLRNQLSATERANMALLSTSPSLNEPQAPQLINIDTIKLPDPALQPDEYATAVQRRTEAQFENNRRKQEFEQSQQAQIKEKADRLWDAFTEKYPGIAEDKARIEFVAARVASAAKARGIDVQRYMFGTQDKYIADVAAEYEKIFGPVERDDVGDDTNDYDWQEDEDYVDEEPRPRQRRQAQRQAPAPRSRRRQRAARADRTGGIFGGYESGHRPSRVAEEDGPDMIDDLHNLQRKTGFF